MKPNQSTRPSPGHRLLNAFVGRWNTSGEIIASEGNPAVSISGTDTYEWLPGEFFLLHRVDVTMGDQLKQSIEIIGYDPSTNNYTMQYFDQDGHSGSMQANLNNSVWTFLADEMRFTGKFSEDGNNLSGLWEQSLDGKSWMPWMKINLEKK